MLLLKPLFHSFSVLPFICATLTLIFTFYVYHVYFECMNETYKCNKKKRKKQQQQQKILPPVHKFIWWKISIKGFFFFNLVFFLLVCVCMCVCMCSGSGLLKALIKIHHKHTEIAMVARFKTYTCNLIQSHLSITTRM